MMRQHVQGSEMNLGVSESEFFDILVFEAYNELILISRISLLQQHKKDAAFEDVVLKNSDLLD